MKTKNQKSKIEVIITGGTVDSYYETTKDTVVPLKNSVVPNFIKSLKINDVFSFTQICMKDSRAIDSKDRKKILQILSKTDSKKILITHGTYTMPDTARFLETHLKRKDQVVLVTGSMIPMTGFSPSDAPFNLGYSLASLKTLHPGIYVCMNGQIFSPKEVIKIISEGRFVSVFNKN